MTRPLEDVQDEILDRVHAGETLDRDALLQEHPEHEEALKAFFEVLDLVEGTGAEDELALARLGEFRIIRELGRGGMGRVYEAEQTSLKRRVALKVLPPTLRLDPRLVSRFRREAEAAGRLRHPGIVPVFSVGEAAGAPFFAMELVDGASLQEVIAQRREGDDAGLPSDPEAWRRWAVETVAQVADALAYAHEKGILHRDVKPANILLDEGGAPRLTDFGLALDLRAPEITQTGEVFGSPMYMSPEQAIRRETPIDERTDVYSLGVTLYELLTLRLPYAATTNAEVLTALITGRIVPPRKVDPSMPRALEQVLLGALHKDPRNRYRGVAEFAHDLRAAVEGDAPAYRPSAPLWPRLRGPVAALGLLAIVAFAVHLGSGAGQGGGGEQDDAERAEHGRDLEAERAAAEQVLAEYLGLGPAVSPNDYEVAFARLRPLDPAVKEDVLRRIYEGYVEGPGKDDPEARFFLGYREYPHQLTETLAYTGRPFVRVVEAAAEKRWFAPDEEEDWILAMRAWQETLRHEQALASDASARAVEGLLANIGSEKALRDFHLTPRWEGPYLVCHLGTDPVSDYDLFGVPPGEERDARRATLAERREKVDRALQDTAKVYASLYAEYVRRYGAEAGIRPLLAPWGGRPDDGVDMRSFEDGVALGVLLFASREAWHAYHVAEKGGPLPPGIRAYFVPRTGRILVAAPEPGESSISYEQSSLLHEGVHQLQHWFRRQRHQWKMPAPRQSWFEEGLGDYLSGVRRDPDESIVFDGYNRYRLTALQTTRRRLERQGKEYPIIPLERLLAFDGYGEVVRWTAANEQVPRTLGLVLFFQQAWALTYFLNEYEDGRFRKQYEKLFEDALSLQRPQDPNAQFRRAFGLTSEAFARLEAMFHAYLMDELMAFDPRGRQFN